VVQSLWTIDNIFSIQYYSGSHQLVIWDNSLKHFLSTNLSQPN